MAHDLKKGAANLLVRREIVNYITSCVSKFLLDEKMIVVFHLYCLFIFYFKTDCSSKEQKKHFKTNRGSPVSET